MKTIDSYLYILGDQINTKKNLSEKVLIFIQSYGFVKIALVGTGTETKIFAVATHTQCHTRYEVCFFCDESNLH